MMQTKNERKRVKFNVDDIRRVSMDLNNLGIDRRYIDASMEAIPAEVTAYYDNADEARRLFMYLVHHASDGNKIEWQQEGAHREIVGWCELCEVVNGGECDGGCLVDHRLGKHPDTLFVRSANKGTPFDFLSATKRK